VIHTALLAAAALVPTGTVVTFEDQPIYLLATPESLFFRQYAHLGLTNVNSSAAGGYLLQFPSLAPTRTFIPPHNGGKANWVRCAGTPLPPDQTLEFAAAQTAVSFWLAVDAAVTMNIVAMNGAGQPIQTVSQAMTTGGWVPINLVAAGPAIRSVRIRSVDGAGAYRYINWAMDDLVFLGPVQACGQSDIGSVGGTDGADGNLDNNDFVVFIDRFFNHDPRADVGVTGGLPGADQMWDNNDFVVFIDQFFTGCV